MQRKTDAAGVPLETGFYPRDRIIWFRYKDVAGKWQNASSGEVLMSEAWKVRAAVQRKVRAAKESGDDVGPLTLGRYIEKQWLPPIVRRNPAYAAFHEDNLNHVEKKYRDMLLEDIRRQHLLDLVRDLEAKGLAPRTIHCVYGSLRRVYREALVRELVDFTPCTLSVRDGDLPKKRDKNPTWRKTAMFTKEEVIALLSDQRLPQHRRVCYAILLLAGLRSGELVARRWRDYDPSTEPLGKLVVDTSAKRMGEGEKSTKTGIAREHPVHPTLAAMLAEWRLSGWAKTYGRAPKPDDFIVPAVPTKRNAGQPLRRLYAKRPYKWLNGYKRKGKPAVVGDLERLGMRPRRAHDARRTFISLAQDAGAVADILEYITHGPAEAEAFGLYTTFSWEAQCREVAKLSIHPKPRAAR